MKKIKEYKYHVLAFLVPFLTFLFMFFTYNDSFYDLLISDAGQQYIYFFDYFKGVLSGEKSLFYSFSSGIGNNFFSTYLYYLSSPLNLLLFFVPYDFIHVFFGLLIFFKIGLSGLTMFIYIKSTNKNNDKVNLLLSLSYSLMTYNIVYYFNIMWLDIVFLTPLVILGLDRLINYDKSGYYILFLSISIFSNFYIAYMLCIFCVLYFLYKIFCLYRIKADFNKIKRLVIRFIKSSMLCGLICSVVIIPLIFLITYFYRIENQYNFLPLFSFFNFFSQIGVKLPNSKSMDYYLPFFHSNFVVFSLVVNYLIFEKFCKRKLLTVLFILIFIISITIEPISTIWHGFSQPVGLCFRFVFLFSFFLILISNEWISRYQSFNKKQLFTISILWIFVFCLSNIVSNQSVNFVNMFINLFFLIGSLLLLNSNQNMCVLIFFIVLQVIFNMKCIFITNVSFTNEEKIVNLNMRNELCNILNNLEDDFYRINFETDYYDSNMFFPCKRGGINLFITTNNKFIFKFLKNSGYFVTPAFSSSDNNLTLMNSILGLKFNINESLENESYSEYKKISIYDNEHYVYKNESALSIGFMIDGVDFENNKHINPFEYQNKFFSTLINQPVEIFYNQKIKTLMTTRNIKFNVEKNKKEYLYLEQLKSASGDRFDIYIDGKLVHENYSVSNGVLELNFNDPGEHELTIKSSEESLKSLKNIKNVYVYSYNVEDANKVITILKNHELNVVNLHKNELIGSIDVKDDEGTLLITLPYEKGWRVKVDGKKANYEQIMDNTFIGIKLGKGFHTIEMVYYPPGIFLGFFLTILSIICLFFTKFYKKYKKI